MWFLFISIQTNFHTINKRNCNLGEINWLSTLLFRGGENAGDEPQSDSQTRQTAFHNQLQGKAICCCWKRRGKANIKPLLINWNNLKIAGSNIHTRCWLWLSFIYMLSHSSFSALHGLSGASIYPWSVSNSATSRQLCSQETLITAI